MTPSTPPIATAAITAPSTLLEGDTSVIAVSANTTGGAISEIVVTVNGTELGRVAGASGSIRHVPAAGVASYQATPVQGGANVVPAAAQTSVRTLLVTARWESSGVAAGDTARLTVVASRGADTVAVSLDRGESFVAAGDSATFRVPVLQAGPWTATPLARNASLSRTGIAISTVVLRRYSARVLIADATLGPVGALSLKIDGTNLRLPRDTTLRLVEGLHSIEIVPRQPHVIDVIGLIQAAADTILVLDLNTMADTIRIQADQTWTARVVSALHPEVSSLGQACITDVFFGAGAFRGIRGLALPRNTQGVRTLTWYLQRSALAAPSEGINAVPMSDAHATLWRSAIQLNQQQMSAPIENSFLDSQDVLKDAMSIDPARGYRIKPGNAVVFDQNDGPPSGGPTQGPRGHLVGYGARVRQNDSFAQMISELDAWADRALLDTSRPGCDTRNNNYGRLAGRGSLDRFVLERFVPFADWKANHELPTLLPFPPGPPYVFPTAAVPRS